MSELEITGLNFTGPSMRDFNLEITAKVNSEVDIGWISCVTVSIFYRRRLIGKKVLRNTYIIPDETNGTEMELEGLKIRDMIGFQAFIQRLMPKTGIKRQKEGQTSITASVDSDTNGHKLSMAIDLNDISSVSISDVDFQVADKNVTLKFGVSSWNPVDMPFGYCRFSLKKDETLLVSLEGHFDILPNYHEVTLTGDVEAINSKFSGTAILKGVKTFDYPNSWLARAIRLFEVEVKLD